MHKPINDNFSFADFVLFSQVVFGLETERHDSDPSLSFLHKLSTPQRLTGFQIDPLYVIKYRNVNSMIDWHN